MQCFISVLLRVHYCLTLITNFCQHHFLGLGNACDMSKFLPKHPAAMPACVPTLFHLFGKT